MKKRTQKTPAFDVMISDPKPNPMFTAYQHTITKYITYTERVPCAHCGKPSKRHWTQLKFFHVMELGFTLTKSKAAYPPLTPVCTDHILAPVLD